MVKIALTAAEWDLVLSCLDSFNSWAVENIKSQIDDQLAEQEY